MLEPTLIGVKTLLVVGFHLSQSGRIQEAWVLFGLTTRLAYTLDLHRDPTCLERHPSPRECAVRRGAWWWMLYSDVYLSLMLGRPLSINVHGNSPPPAPWSIDSMESRLCGLMVDFVLAARRILGSDATISDVTIQKSIKELTDLWDTTPEALRFNRSWAHLEQDHPQWPLDIIVSSKRSFYEPDMCHLPTNTLRSPCRYSLLHRSIELSAHCSLTTRREPQSHRNFRPPSPST